MKLLTLALCISFFGLNACAPLQKKPIEPTTDKPPATQEHVQPRSERSLYLGAQTAIHNGQPALAIQFLEVLLDQQSRNKQQENKLDDLTPRLQLADLLIKSNRSNDALQYLQKAVQLTPINKDNTVEQQNLHLMYARALAGSKQYDAALDALVRLLAQHPSFTPARHLQITLFIYTKQLALAHIAINMAIKQQDTAKLRQFQADVFTRQGKFQKAARSLKKMYALNPKDDTAILLLSQLEIQQKHLDKAEKILRDFNKKEPSSLRVQHALARLLIQSDRPQEAIAIYQQMLHTLPNSAEIQSALGLLYYRQQQFQEASEHFDKALQIAPQNQSYRFYFASSLEAMQKNKQARILYEQIDPQHELWKEAQLRLASMDFIAKKYAFSQQHIQNILKKDPNNAQAWVLSSTLYLAQEQYQQLLDATQAAMSLQPVPARLQMNRAIAYEHFKRYQDVERTLKALIQNNPEHADALNFLAYTYAEQGIKLDKAKEYIQRALAKKANDGYYLDTLAWVYYKHGQYNKAVATQQKALQAIHDDATMYEHLGDMFWKLGKQEQAIEQWQKALSLQPDKPAALHHKIKHGLK